MYIAAKVKHRIGLRLSHIYVQDVEKY
jgi:hypothetical protein